MTITFRDSTEPERDLGRVPGPDSPRVLRVAVVTSEALLQSRDGGQTFEVVLGF